MTGSTSSALHDRRPIGDTRPLSLPAPLPNLPQFVSMDRLNSCSRILAYANERWVSTQRPAQQRRPSGSQEAADTRLAQADGPGISRGG